MRFTRTGAAAVALLALTAPAWAQTSAAPPEPVMLPGANWAGFYLGADVGGVWSNQSFSTALPRAAPTGGFNTLLTAPFDGSLGWPTSRSGSTTGFTGGGHLGYNWDIGNGLILGAEADLQYSGGTIGSNSSFLATNSGSGTGTGIVTNSISSNTPWFGTVRARLGTTAFNPNLLLYGTGGFAYGRNTTTDTMSVSSGGALVERFPFSVSSNVPGYAVGAGAEWALNDRWSIKAEYLYVNLKESNTENVGTTVLGARALTTDAMTFKASSPSMNIARIGISYHFGPPPPPPPVMPAAMPAPPPPAAARVFLVFFDWDRDNITPQGMQIVEQAADAYRAGASVRLMVTGYTDRSGSPGYNQRLSERRAHNVAKALQGMGVPRQQMAVSGKGENDNRVPTAPGVREPQNRRVEIGVS